MLKISSTQYNTLSAHSKRNFEERLALWLIDRFSTQFTQDEAEKLAHQAIAKCSSYDIQVEKNVTYMAERMVTEGINFEHLPSNEYAKKILDDNTIAGDDKIYDIYKHELATSLLSN